MPSDTANLHLAFPTADDRPCDLADAMVGNAQLIEDALLAIGAKRDRFWPAIPMAMIMTTTVSTASNPSGGFISPIDAEVYDTDGIVDTDRDANRIQISRGAVWLSIASQAVQPVNAGSQETVGFSNDFGVGNPNVPEIGSYTTTVFGGDTVLGYVSVLFQRWTAVWADHQAEGADYGLVYSSQGAVAQSLQQGQLAVHWLRDDF